MAEFQEQDKKKLLQKGDKVIIRIPILDHPITINEIHAFQLGLVGLASGFLFASGQETIASFVSLLLVGYAILGNPIFTSMSMDDPDYKTIGMKTIKHEPWWFTVPYFFWFVLGASYIFV